MCVRVFHQLSIRAPSGSLRHGLGHWVAPGFLDQLHMSLKASTSVRMTERKREMERERQIDREREMETFNTFIYVVRVS